MVKIGKISGVFGVKGWVKIFSYTDKRDNILDFPYFIVKKSSRATQDKNATQRLDIVKIQSHGKKIIAQLVGVNDPDKAATLVGKELFIEDDQLPDLAEDEYYWSDLIGLNVVNSSGEELGQVEQLLETGAHDVLEVSNNSNDREYLIPYVLGKYVLNVDLEQKVIEVEWDSDWC